MKTNLFTAILLITILVLGAGRFQSTQAALVDTTFTYQGQLNDSNGPVNGTFDISFRLFKAATTGSVFANITNSPVTVSNGFFTTMLDFGTVFDGTAYWLSVGLRTNGDPGVFTYLTPRQKLTAVPYAQYSTNAAYANSAGFANTAGNATNLSANIVSTDKLASDIGVWTKSGTAISYTAGRVGIGTNSPVTDLHVAGSLRASGGINSEDRFVADAGTNSRPGYSFSGDGNTGFYSPGADNVAVATGGNERMRISPAGNVGIGTPTPNAQLEVQPSGNVDSVLRVTSPGTGIFPNVYNSMLQLVDVQTNGWSIFKDQANHLSFRDAKTGLERARFQANGNVGIGGTVTTNVASRVLAIVGDSGAAQYPGTAGILLNDPAQGNIWSIVTYTTGNLHFDKVAGAGKEVVVPILTIVGGSDIAEPFDISSDIQPEPGMVVAIDPTGTGELQVCARAYDPTVAGIISGAGGVKTGMTLKQSGTIADGDHPVALTGRVYCYVDAEAGGAVTPGDLLTTSATPGHAMKVTDRVRAAGATLGKAMSSLKEGRGLVLVLVSLQ